MISPEGKALYTPYDIVFLGRYSDRIINTDLKTETNGWSSLTEERVFGIDGGAISAYSRTQAGNTECRVIVEYPAYLDVVDFGATNLDEFTAGKGLVNDWIRDRLNPNHIALKPDSRFPASRHAAEEQVLISLIHHPEDLQHISEFISAYTFTADLRSLCFTVIARLDDKGHSVNLATIIAGVTRELRKLSEPLNDHINRVSEPIPYLWRLGCSSPSRPQDVVNTVLHLCNEDMNTQSEHLSLSVDASSSINRPILRPLLPQHPRLHAAPIALQPPDPPLDRPHQPRP